MSSGCEKGDSSLETSASASRPPRSVALVNAAGCIGAGNDACNSIAFLLDDFEEAYRAYAHEMAQMFGVSDDVTTPRFVRMAPQGDDAFAAHAECGSVVIGYALEADEDAAGSIANAVRLLSPVDASRGMRVYAIAVDHSYDAENALVSLDALRVSCSEAGLLFSGGVLIGGGALLPRLVNKPRMGVARRRVSEATDELIEAVREGRDAGVIKAKPPMPRFLYNRLL